MATTNIINLANKMRILRTHGITRDPDLMTHDPDGEWYYQQIDLGFNYRMTDIAAALGISQLLRLDSNIKKRHEIVRFYNKALSSLPLMLPYSDVSRYSSCHLYIVRIKNKKKLYSEIFELLTNFGIGVNKHYIPIHTQPFYKNFGFKSGDFPESESYYREAISLPIFPDLTKKEQESVISAVSKALE
jgi:dTDP-4-amino-4,6-dideoxygalactose transaminase